MNTIFLQRLPTRHLVIATLMAVAITGCGGNQGDVRVYHELRVAPEAPPPRMSPHGSPASQRAPAAPPQVRSTGLAWDTPESWTETPGTGMRIATFNMSSEGAEGTCTLITLSGPAGGLESNVARWLGQLDLPVPEEAAFAQLLESQERLQTQGELEGVIVDLLPLTREQGTREDSMIVGVVTIGSQTAFLKLTGPLALLDREKPQLQALTRSFRIDP